MCVQHQCYFGVNINLNARNAISAHTFLNLVSLDGKDSAVKKSTYLSKIRLKGCLFTVFCYFFISFWEIKNWITLKPRS
jgi:hypothetical protein